jgi:hypothetical protein
MEEEGRIDRSIHRWRDAGDAGLPSSSMRLGTRQAAGGGGGGGGLVCRGLWPWGRAAGPRPQVTVGLRRLAACMRVRCLGFGSFRVGTRTGGKRSLG